MKILPPCYEEKPLCSPLARKGLRIQHTKCRFVLTQDTDISSQIKLVRDAIDQCDIFQPKHLAHPSRRTLLPIDISTSFCSLGAQKMSVCRAKDHFVERSRRTKCSLLPALCRKTRLISRHLRILCHCVGNVTLRKWCRWRDGDNARYLGGHVTAPSNAVHAYI